MYSNLNALGHQQIAKDTHSNSNSNFMPYDVSRYDGITLSLKNFHCHFSIASLPTPNGYCILHRVPFAFGGNLTNELKKSLSSDSMNVVLLFSNAFGVNENYREHRDLLSQNHRALINLSYLQKMAMSFISSDRTPRQTTPAVVFPPMSNYPD